MRITGSQLRTVIREEIIRESHRAGHPSPLRNLPDGWTETGELQYEHPAHSLFLTWNERMQSWELSDPVDHVAVSSPAQAFKIARMMDDRESASQTDEINEGFGNRHSSPDVPAFLPDGWEENGEYEYTYDPIPAVVVYWDAIRGTWVLGDYHNKTDFESAEHAMSYVMENEDDPRMSWNW